VKAFWRWLTQPVISVADGLLMAGTVLAADVMNLAWHLPWPAVVVIVSAIVAAALFGIGFAKGFARSMLADYRRWRAGRD